MKNDDLIQRLKAQLNQCGGFTGDELAKDRQAALDYYLMRPNGTEVPGRSTVVAGDVSAVVESVVTSITEAFTTDALVDFAAFGEEDEEQAVLEGAAVEHFVMGESNGLFQFTTAAKEAALMRNGWVKVWIEDEHTKIVQEFEGVGPEAYIEITERPDVKDCKVIKYDPETGYLKISCTHVRKRFRAEAVPVENVLYPKDYDGVDFRAIQAIPFIHERHVDTRHELVRRGFSEAKVERLKGVKADASGNLVALARTAGQVQDNTPAVDDMSELVEWYESHVYIDGERTRVCWSDNEILEREFTPLVPLAAGVVIPMPHRLTGVSLWDKARQSQDLGTALHRQLLDGLSATSKNRTASLDGKVNTDDLADGRVNGNIRVKASAKRVQDAVMPFTVPDTSAGTIAAIQNQRQIRTELTGASLDMQSAEIQLNRQAGSQGIDRIYSAGEALAGFMARTFAQTLVRSVFLLAHATLREYWYPGEPVNIKVNGRWLSPVPSEWPARERVTVKVGMSPGERTRRLASLDKLLQSQVALAQMGMDDVLVNGPRFYNLLLDWARVAEVPSPERYFIDPLSDESKAAVQRKTAQAQQIKAQQEQLVQQAVDLEKIKTALDKYKHDSELQFKYWEAVLDSEIEEAKLAGKATVDLLRVKAALLKPNPEDPTAVSHRNMKQRADDETDPDYGGKGVDVDPKLSTVAGLKDEVGERPPGMTLDRLNPEGDYEPGNVRWATPGEQK